MAKAKPRTAYVDGFVLLVPTKKLPAYRKMAKLGCKVWMEHGALDYKETIGDDLKVKWGLPFTQLTKAKRGETVIFSWITYQSRAHRDKVNAKVMKDERMKMGSDPMPFDMKRMSYGGFKVIVSN